MSYVASSTLPSWSVVTKLIPWPAVIYACPLLAPSVLSIYNLWSCPFVANCNKTYLLRQLVASCNEACCSLASCYKAWPTVLHLLRGDISLFEALLNRLVSLVSTLKKRLPQFSCFFLSAGSQLLSKHVRYLLLVFSRLKPSRLVWPCRDCEI